MTIFYVFFVGFFFFSPAADGPAELGGCEDKVKELLRGGGRCLCLCMRGYSCPIIWWGYFLCVLSSTCRPQRQSGRRKHVLSLMTECHDCPCWGKEACQGVFHFTDNHIRHGRPPLSDWAQTLTFHETLWAKTQRFWVWLPGQIKSFGVTLIDSGRSVSWCELGQGCVKHPRFLWRWGHKWQWVLFISAQDVTVSHILHCSVSEMMMWSDTWCPRARRLQKI